MAVISIKSSSIQTVRPGSRIESGRTSTIGNSGVSENYPIAQLDANSPKASTLTPYDGLTCFGLFIVDESLDGFTT